MLNAKRTSSFARQGRLRSAPESVCMRAEYIKAFERGCSLWSLNMMTNAHLHSLPIFEQWLKSGNSSFSFPTCDINQLFELRMKGLDFLATSDQVRARCLPIRTHMWLNPPESKRFLSETASLWHYSEAAKHQVYQSSGSPSLWTENFWRGDFHKNSNWLMQRQGW